MEFTSITSAKKQTGFSYLGSVEQSAKLKKNSKIGQLTYSLYLAPASLSGYNTCPMATKECIAGCLNTSGRVKMDTKNTIINSRINKTKLYFEHREFFMAWLIAEIETAKKKAEKKGMGFSVRLNCTSDIDWSLPKYNGKNVFEIFPTVQFYGYTKIAKKFRNMAPNQHLTYSYTGYNSDMAKQLLSQGYNVAVIFDIKKDMELPATFMGYEVIDGDITDYRPADKKGTIVGLRWKNIRDKQAENMVRNSPFVVSSLPKVNKVELKKVA